jgi:hypothetical protein
VRFLFRYIEILATAQFYASEKGMYSSDRDAFYYAGKVIALVPILHAISLEILVHLLERACQLSNWDTPIARVAIALPFFGVSVFLTNDYEYLLNLRTRIRADSPEAKARRQREARTFVRNTYIMWFFTILAIFASIAIGSGF